MNNKIEFTIKLPPLSLDFDLRRNNLRKMVIEQFLKEKPGKGIGDDTSKYCYTVERFANGGILQLIRPANLKNGFDFLIEYPNSNINSTGKNKHAPSFDGILFLIKNNIKDNNFKESFYEKIEKVFKCEEVNNFYSEDEEIILKICKWFFIEQDIRYWNYSGRYKFYGEIKKYI